MITITKEEVDNLAYLLSRAGVNPVEVMWANAMLDRLRALAAEMSAPKPKKEK
jgi:hypothetical protein